VGSPFSSALEELRHRHDLLTAEVKRLARLIRELEQLPTSINDPYAAVSALPSEAPAEGPPAIAIRPSEFARMSYAQASRVIIRRVNQSLSTSELLRFLEAGDRAVRGKDPYRTLYRTLMKHSAFKNVDKKWTLTDWSETEDLLDEK